MTAKDLVKASEFQIRYARAKKFFPKDNERMLLMRIASKYYTSLDEVRDIVDFIQSVDASKPLDKVDLYVAKRDYLAELDKKEKDTKKAKDDKTAEYTTQCSVYTTTVNNYNRANVEEGDRKTKKFVFWGALAIAVGFLFFGIGGFAGIGTFLASLTVTKTLGLAAGVLGVLAGKRMYDTRVKPKKVASLQAKQEKLNELKAKVPEEKKKRDDLQTEKTNAETAYNDAVAKKTSERTAIAGFKEPTIVQELADQKIEEIEQITSNFLATAPTGTAHRSALSWKNRYIQMIGKWVSDGTISRPEHFDTIISHFNDELAQVAVDHAHESGLKESVYTSITFGGGAVAKPDSATIESSF